MSLESGTRRPSGGRGARAGPRRTSPEGDTRRLVARAVERLGLTSKAGDFRWAQVTETSDYDLVAKLEGNFFAEPITAAVHRLAEAQALVELRPSADGRLREGGDAMPSL